MAEFDTILAAVKFEILQQALLMVVEKRAYPRLLQECGDLSSKLSLTVSLAGLVIDFLLQLLFFLLFEGSFLLLIE